MPAPAARAFAPMIQGAILLAGIVALMLPAPSRAQTGAVASTAKINSASLSGLLDNGDEFGDAVASLGDLDGAGPSVAALAVGAVGDDDGGSHRGAVYILFLNASGGVMSTRKISATQGNFTATLNHTDELGGALASLGDLDGPGPSVCALAVGAIGDDDGGIDRGAVHILFLNASGLVIKQQKISATAGNFAGPLDDLDEFGGSLASLGDLDGAGASARALAVGAIGDDDGGVDRGAVYILLLGTTGTVLSTQKLGAASSMLNVLSDGDTFGEDVASLGDLDGAGPSVQAIAVGAVGDHDGGSHYGAVYVLFLNASGAILSRQKISDTQGNFTPALQYDDSFGSAVAGLGDLDGPGPSAGALAVGVAGADGQGLDRGAIHVLLLNSAGSVLSSQEISGTAGNFGGQLDDSDEFGSGLAALGDLNGPAAGVQTLTCGVSFDDDDGLDRGAVYLMSLSGGGTVGVDAASRPEEGAALAAPRPSVFRDRTTIPFRIARAARVRIEVRDVAGRRVRVLADDRMEPGERAITWDGADDRGRPVAPGGYFVRMSIDGRTAGAARTLLVR